MTREQSSVPGDSARDSNHDEKDSPLAEAAFVLRQRRSRVFFRVLLSLALLVFYSGVVWRGNPFGWLGIVVGLGTLWLFGADLTRHAAYIELHEDHLVLKHQLAHPDVLPAIDILEFEKEKGRAHWLRVRLTPGGSSRIRHGRRGPRAVFVVPVIDGYSADQMLELLERWHRKALGEGAT